MTVGIVDDERGRRIVLSGRWQNDHLGAILASRLDWLTIRGFAGPDLEFLDQLESVGIEQLDILGRSIPDVSGVRFLPTLQRLNVGARYRRRIELTSLRGLTELHLEWGPGAESLVACQMLTSLSLQRPGISGPSFLSDLACLESLRLADSGQVLNVNGVERLPRLRSVRLLDLQGLADITALAHAPALSDLTFEGCVQIRNLTPLAAQASLRRIALVDCGEIESLDPLMKLASLEELLVSGTRINDLGAPDLSTLTGLRKLILRGTGLSPAIADDLEFQVRQRSAT